MLRKIALTVSVLAAGAVLVVAVMSAAGNKSFAQSLGLTVPNEYRFCRAHAINSNVSCLPGWDEVLSTSGTGCGGLNGATYTITGEKTLDWRVAVLAGLGENEQLFYKERDPNAAWVETARIPCQDVNGQDLPSSLLVCCLR